MGAFHAYDIRGIWGTDINPDFAYQVGRAFVRFAGLKAVQVGHDARLHSPELYEKLIEGLLDEGADVTGIGLCSTPQMHFYQMRAQFPAGVMVTASHNPKDYHGFKLFDGTGGSVSYEKGLNKIEAMMKEGLPEASQPRGKRTDKVLIDEYVDFIAQKARGLSFSAPVVIDATNGSAGRVFQLLAEKLNLKAEIINADPNGNFPNHDPNPLKEESRRQIRAKVRESHAACGIVLDGDGDRIIFIDERGEAVENYFISALIARELLAAQPQAAIVYDLISSRVLPEEINAQGGKAVISKVGYTFLYDKMVESRALFGAETSGHVYFKVDDLFYTESAAYAFVVMLTLLSRLGEPLSKLLAPLRARYFQAPELNVKVADKDKALALIAERFKDGELSMFDGVSVSYGDYWFNVRPSNTEPLLRVRLEGVSEEVTRQTIIGIEEILATA